MEQLLDASTKTTTFRTAAFGLARLSAQRVTPPQSEEMACEVGGVAHVRRFEPRDVAQVTELFVETFRRGLRTNRQALARCIAETYLATPPSLDAPHSVVHVEDGDAVTGFVGILHAAMKMNDRAVKVGVLGAFMASHPDENPAIAVRLARALRTAPLDLFMSDTTNPRSLVFCRALRFELLPSHGLEWVKLLRPAEALAGLFARRVASAEPLAVGLAKFVEPLARRLYDSSLNEPDRPANRANLIDVDGFVERAEILTREWSLKPDWRSDATRWLIERAALKARNGPMRLCEVVQSNGRLAGVYILYAGRGKIAHALQILARPNREREVIASLLRLADDEGASAVRGVVDPRVLTGLAGLPRIFYHQGAAAIAFSQDPEIRGALKEGKALIGGLIGERWNRLVADPFD